MGEGEGPRTMRERSFDADVIVGREVLAMTSCSTRPQTTLYECVEAMLDDLDRANPLPACFCPATSEYDPPCPRHGVVGIGVTPRG